MNQLLAQNNQLDALVFQMDAAGLSPTVVISKNGAAFAPPAGAVSEIGSGWYKVAPNLFDAATLGPLILHATAAGGHVGDAEYQVICAFDPRSHAIDVLNENIGNLAVIAARQLALCRENSVLEVATWQGNEVATGTLYAYDSAENAGLNDHATGIVASYAVTAVFSGGRLSRYSVVRL